MKASNDQLFNAKILLFGEYSLLYGSMALSTPFDRFHGRLIWPDGNKLESDDKNSNEHINEFSKYLSELDKKGELTFPLNTSQLSNDVKSGLFFKSNIPRGYGLGSSGALVAAIFKAYGEEQKNEQFSTTSQLADLKAYFAKLESYFHGKSSGLDPLISYLNQAVLVSGNDQIKTLKTSWSSEIGSGAVFLIDSGAPGETQPLVKDFRNKYDNPMFKKSFDQQFIPLVNTTVQSYINHDTELLFQNVKELSAYQSKNFDKMIPESVKDIWRKGLDSDNYYLKLCGSGGGGMMLGFTKDINAAKRELGNYSPIIIHQL